MKSAEAIYMGKSEYKHQLVLMNAQLQLQRGNIDRALSILQSVTPGKNYFNLFIIF